MKTQIFPPFHVVGIAVRTTNENGQASQDIPALWAAFMSQNIIEQIPNKIDNTLYCIYTDYEKDHTRPYTTLLGCRVRDLSVVPEGLVGKAFEGGKYTQRVAKGNILEGMVFGAWQKIWSENLPRTFTADFEFYRDAQNPTDAEVDIFLAVE